MIILSSGYYLNQLLDKRSLVYSNRPPSYIVGEQVYGGDHPMLMNPDERWKHRRKLYFQLLQEAKCNKDHIKIIQAETSQMLRDIVLDPGNLMHHPGRFSNSVIMTLGEICSMLFIPTVGEQQSARADMDLQFLACALRLLILPIIKSCKVSWRI